jgi:hypothetical protein
MKVKTILMALPLAIGTTLLYAADLQTGVINSDTVGAPLRAAVMDPQGYQGDEFAPEPLKQGTKVRLERDSGRYRYQGVDLVQVIPEGQHTPVWTYADKVTVTPQ